eukprot:CAMPEP_0183718832 /NCGR_PEP_ID=MMETSP0737-20130205/11987_1 /TAXON_ID=385413 /ORGANISM="Thalassiosira miniscula, Strain CCMP1093" /LENGTH=102 /DNA_ID=CAMNT_0025948461 /DNA_START=699 /DNA_END=1007 /DNA_ORIENTATION=+
MDRLMEGASKPVRISTKQERQQRWLVNQCNATKTLKMMQCTTKGGVPCPCLIDWALEYANKDKSPWKRHVGKEIATWLSMPSIMLGLHFEAELGSYFEETYA